MDQIFYKPDLQADKDYFDANLPIDKSNLDLMKPYILKLCQNNLSGVWKSVQNEDFKIYRPW